MAGFVDNNNMLIFTNVYLDLCASYFMSDFHDGVAVPDSCRAGKRTLLLWELLSLDGHQRSSDTM